MKVRFRALSAAAFLSWLLVLGAVFLLWRRNVELSQALAVRSLSGSSDTVYVGVFRDTVYYEKASIPFGDGNVRVVSGAAVASGLMPQGSRPIFLAKTEVEVSPDTSFEIPLLSRVVEEGDTFRCFDYSDNWNSVAGCVYGDSVRVHFSSRTSLNFSVYEDKGGFFRSGSVFLRITPSNPSIKIKGMDSWVYRPSRPPFWKTPYFWGLVGVGVGFFAGGYAVYRLSAK